MNDGDRQSFVLRMYWEEGNTSMYSMAAKYCPRIRELVTVINNILIKQTTRVLGILLQMPGAHRILSRQAKAMTH
jgi:hypothetical protein